MAKRVIVGRDGRIIDDDDDVIPDGATLRVPMPFLDAATSAAIASAFGDSVYDQAIVHDGTGGPAGYKPGYAFGGPVPNAHRGTAHHARAAYVDTLSNAWRNPSPLPPPESTEVGASRAGATRDASGDKGGNNGEAAYRAYVNNLSNAWKTAT